MKTTIKKIMGGVLATVAFIVPTVSFAATFNNDPQDFSTLRVVNYTTSGACVTCWGPTATLNTGDVVSFNIYYHNVGPDVATNVRVRLSPQVTTLGSTHTFTATVSADNAPAVSGTVTVNTTPSQTISFLPNAVIWRPNQTVTGSSPLPGAQLPTDIFNGTGINLGSIASGWATQGSLSVRFQASPVGGVGTNTGIGSLPSVTTNTIANVAPDTATLSGYIDPRGTADTVYWFDWGMTQNFGNQTPRYNQGSVASNVTAGLSGLMQNSTYYYRAVAQNSYGVVYGATLSFVAGTSNYNNCGTGGWGGNCANNVVMVSTRNTDTSGDFAVLSGYVDPVNTNDTVRWFDWGGSQALGNSTQKLSHGSVASNFSASLTGLVPSTTYYYRAVARNSQGTVYGNILSFTTSGQTNNLGGSLPAVTTLLATELGDATARLNGLVFTSANQPSNAWFEWGTNLSVGNKTQTVSVGMLPSVKHSEVVTGLSQGQTYYYRIVSENPYGKVYGSINTFVANRVTTPKTASVVVRNTPQSVAMKPTATVVSRGSSAQSLVSLSIDGGADVIVGGEKRSYHVVWKNESAQALRNVVLRITFPKTINFESTTGGIFSAADNTVVVDLLDVPSGESGELFITTTADSGIKLGELIVVTANMVYTSAGGVQGDAIAYVTHRAEVGTTGALGASIFGAGSFLPTTLLGWMFLIILVLALVLLGNHLYGRLSGTPPAH